MIRWGGKWSSLHRYLILNIHYTFYLFYLFCLNFILSSENHLLQMMLSPQILSCFGYLREATLKPFLGLSPCLPFTSAAYLVFTEGCGLNCVLRHRYLECEHEGVEKPVDGGQVGTRSLTRTTAPQLISSHTTSKHYFKLLSACHNVSHVGSYTCCCVDCQHPEKGEVKCENWWLWNVNGSNSLKPASK